MKMVKSLLLGTAAGLLAVAGAQAADMPVKAKAVEYVKVCSLYGAGFYYIPGTDTCLKVGGYLRMQTEYNAGASGQVIGSGTMLSQGRYDISDTNDINWTNRAVVTLDARTQTEYGTLRSYIRAGWNVSTPTQTGAGTTPGAYWDRAFIQFAGFTVGRAQSFFDMYTYGGAYTYLNVRTSGDTGAAGEDLWAYTVQFGNGVSYTLSLEDPAAHNKYGTADNTSATFGGFNPLTAAFGGNTAGFFGYPVATTVDNGYTQNVGGTGFRVPDVVTNLRIDQAWGYLGVSTAIHDASGGYYGVNGTAATTPPLGIPFDTVNAGHPATKYGWAASVSGFFNLQGGDSVGFNVVWTKGAPGYAFNSGNWALFKNSNSIGVGWIADGVYGIGTDIELTQSWSINAGYQHIWGPAGTFGGKWRTTVYGGYVSVNYNDRATQLINSALPAGNICGGTRAAATAANPGGTTFTGWVPLAGNSCSPDFSFYQVGSRTQFNPHPLIDIGLDVFYTRLNTAYKGPVNWTGSAATAGVNGARPPCTNSAILSCSADDQNVLSAIVRWQRNFYP